MLILYSPDESNAMVYEQLMPWKSYDVFPRQEAELFTCFTHAVTKRVTLPSVMEQVGHRYGLSVKCPLQDHVFDHLVPSWWCCFGRL